MFKTSVTLSRSYNNDKRETNMSYSLNQTTTELADPMAAPKKQRRSNVERSATTRAKVCQAAVQCLYELGYEGTTVILVAKRAGVSRGAAQHQFPSKVDLMMAVTAQIVEQQTRIRQEIWENIPEHKGRVRHLAESAWDFQKQPENVALFEIMMATRNDEELRQRFVPFSKQMSELRTWGAEILAEIAGIDICPELETMVRLYFAAMRGISLDYLLNKDEAGAQAGIDLLIQYQRMMIKDLIDKSKQKQSESKQNLTAPEMAD